MEGAVSNLAPTEAITAPTVNVTWEYEKAADGAEAATDAVDYTANAAPSIATTTYTSNGTEDLQAQPQRSLAMGVPRSGVLQ
jgi:hypothetical protein